VRLALVAQKMAPVKKSARRVALELALLENPTYVQMSNGRLGARFRLSGTTTAAARRELEAASLIARVIVRAGLDLKIYDCSRLVAS
jgi:hypothetical protein